MDATSSPEDFEKYKAELETSISEGLYEVIRDNTIMAFNAGFDARLIAAFQINMQSLAINALKRVTKELEDDGSGEG